MNLYNKPFFSKNLKGVKYGLSYSFQKLKNPKRPRSVQTFV